MFGFRNVAVDTPNIYVDRQHDGIVFRLATEADIEGIIRLSKVALKDEYTIDYVPGWLPKVFDDKTNRFISVGQKGDKIVIII